MLVSYRWLVELCPVDEAAERGAARLTARGLTVDSIDPSVVEDDVVLDVDVPANRPDCLGHLGIARELSAAPGVALRDDLGGPDPAGAPVDATFKVRIEAPDLCARFTASLVRGVTIGRSPAGVVRRLAACGLRSVNNVVDVSNLVLLELGQPIHFYDAATLVEGTVVVRESRTDESVRTIDDEVRPLLPGMLAIADPDRVVGIAGLMGGAETEITASTKDVFVEAAWFSPSSIRSTSRALRLSTDASQRFERGCDPGAPLRAQALACRLLAELCGGVVAPGTIDVVTTQPAPRTATLRAARLTRVLGTSIDSGEIDAAFTALGFRFERPDNDTWTVAVPTWRVDLEREVDLIEEVARHVGYDRIPATLPALVGAPVEGTTHPLDEPARTLLAHLGFLEAFNYAMIAEGDDRSFVGDGAPAAERIENPISDQLSHLRRSILPGLLASVDRNLRRGARDIRLFEVGRVFERMADADSLPREPLRLGIAWTGASYPAHWDGPTGDVALSDIAGVVERVLDSLRPGAQAERVPGADGSGWHPGRSLSWRTGDAPPVAWAGALHPDRRAALDLSRTPFLAEVDLDRLLECPAPGIRYRAVPRVPSAARDLSLVLGPGVAYGDLVRHLRAIPAPAPATFEVRDRYVGEPLDPGEVSLTVRVILQPLDRTLTDERTEEYRRKLVAALEATRSVRLRS